MKDIPLLFVTLLLLPTFCSSQDGQQRFASLGDFKLESGETILDCRIGYRTFGRLNPTDRSNIVVMSTWFTGATGEMT
jgi:homoserine O-acetyltransferase